MPASLPRGHRRTACPWGVGAAGRVARLGLHSPVAGSCVLALGSFYECSFGFYLSSPSLFKIHNCSRFEVALPAFGQA